MIKRRFKKSVMSLAVTSAMLFTALMPFTCAEAATVDTSTYKGRFLEQYNKMKDPKNGYFSVEGIPYHTVENLLCEAPDIGHQTVSETLSYYAWFEALYGKLFGDFTGFKESWKITEKYLIPTHEDQPTNNFYASSTNKPATYAPEWETPDKYPSPLNGGGPVGSDPIGKELSTTYGTWDIYGMHWMIDTDNWYGFGNRGDGTSRASYMNTFQRGEHESVWETIPQPCWDEMKWGGKNGFLDLFVGDGTYAKQWKYTNAPDADARQIQATYWANKWAKEQGFDVSTETKMASKMGDYLRYAMFDKYFRKIGQPQQAGNGYDSCHYLLSWYYAWGGGLPSTTGSGNWAWRIGCSHNHGGYQNPFAAWALAKDADLKPKSANGASDWQKSLDRQIEFITWLQSEEGGIAGGATNSWNGRYETPPAGTSTFYGMPYKAHPVYCDPDSNRWFGFQCWGMQRSMELLYETKDERLKAVCTKWAKWAMSQTKINADGSFEVPSTLIWTGQPDTWTGKSTGNPNLHVKVQEWSKDLGVAGSFANALLYYSAATGDLEAKKMAKTMLDHMWQNNRDEKGISAPEEKLGYSAERPEGDPYGYKRFFEGEVYIPAGWSGKMPNGDVIKPGVKFIDIRSKYKEDPNFTRLEEAWKNKKPFEMTYHRFWAQSDILVALGTMAILFPDEKPGNGSDPNNFSISGFISPYEVGSDALLKDIKVEVAGTNLSALTDNKGAFEIKNVPKSTTGYTLKLSKPTYLAREIKNVVVTSNTAISTQDKPTALWLGDMDGDGAINMADILIIAGSFNTFAVEGRYDPDRDLNKNGAVNMEDIMIAAKHFNATAADYSK